MLTEPFIVLRYLRRVQYKIHHNQIKSQTIQLPVNPDSTEFMRVDISSGSTAQCQSRPIEFQPTVANNKGHIS